MHYESLAGGGWCLCFSLPKTAYWSCVETASKDCYSLFCFFFFKVGLHLMAWVLQNQAVPKLSGLPKSAITLDVPAVANLTGISC